jgi:putative N6-adenine-specific DNA methylase
MNPSLQKRIRRHVVGKLHDFFAATAPGIEPLCLKELAALGVAGREVPGGVEFKGRLHECYRANLHLRTAGRILMRIHSFHATSFSALEREAHRFAWELFLPQADAPRIQVATRRCRLHHTGAIAERVLRGVQEHLGPPTEAPPDNSPCLQQIFIRGADDRFVVSIDSSGANLYRRGIKTHGGTAPLRETLAAAALMWCGYTAAEPLLDPMCGAGTFSLEAALWAKRIPPGWFRDFAFTRWPACSGPRWAHMKRTASESFATLETPRILASDTDAEACRRLEACVEASGLADAVAVHCADFFSLDPAALAVNPGIVVLNPPYGRRLGAPRAGRDLLRRMVERLATHYRGWRFALLTPQEIRTRALPFPHAARPFLHGGMRVELVVGDVPPRPAGKPQTDAAAAKPAPMD